MVFFTCNLCGNPLKKNQVDKHLFQCRTQSLSCMDCQKDFSVKEYSSHTKCISEEEKYGGEGWKAPSNFNKGEKKQQAWIDTVNETLNKAGGNLSAPAKNLLKTLARHDNVPRKKAKFLNFINNIARHKFDVHTLETVWNLMEEQWKAQAEANKKDASSSKNNFNKKLDGKENESKNKDKKEESDVVVSLNGHSGDEVVTTTEDIVEKKMSKREKKEARKQKQHKEEKKEKRKDEEASEEPPAIKKERKKRKRNDSSTEESTENKKSKGEDQSVEEEEPQEDVGFVGDFKWGETIKQVLLNQPEYEISMKKLRKKVISEYYAVIGDGKGMKTQEELFSKLNKKLKKQQFKVIKDTVKLVV